MRAGWLALGQSPAPQKPQQGQGAPQVAEVPGPLLEELFSLPTWPVPDTPEPGFGMRRQASYSVSRSA